MALRYRKDDPAHNVFVAISRWVKAAGGKVIVIGGIEVQQWAQGDAYQYRVAVRCTGRKPTNITAKE